MANHVTKKQVQEEFEMFGNTLNVVFISKEDPNKRTTWGGGLNLHAAFAEMVQAVQHGLSFVIFRDEDLEPGHRHTWDMEPYRKAASKFKFDHWKLGRIQ